MSYRDRMEGPMEALACEFHRLGITVSSMDDDEIVEGARKLIILLQSLIIASGIRKEILDVLIQETIK